MGKYKHKMWGTPEYWAWRGMLNRCNNPNGTGYSYYGGRGIKVCSKWLHDFMAFYTYIGQRPSSQHSVDRINPDGDYKPGNVRWATKREQSMNTRLQARNKSGYRGVYWDEKREVWEVHIRDDTYQMNLGLFKEKDQAALVYDAAAIQLRGEFAKTNLL